MRNSWLLLLFAGCTPAVADVDRPGIIAELATHTACILFDLPDAPTPDVPTEGCVDGCTCNGTGLEKTGDGLSTVDCRCPDGCDCKAGNSPGMPDSSSASKQQPAARSDKADNPGQQKVSASSQERPQNTVENTQGKESGQKSGQADKKALSADPPLVPVAPKQSVVRMSGSRWTFEGMGTNPPTAVKAQHLANDHGIDATGMTSSEMSAAHDNAHNYGDSMAYGVTGTQASSCPGGTCPTPSSGTVYRRGLFGRRR